MTKNNLPNFLIVGAAKCATTSFARYLASHSDIFVPEIKEPRYFISDTIKSLNKKDPLYPQLIKHSVLDQSKYYELFDTSKKLAGEASIHYLYHYNEAIPKIKKELGDIPIIIILRHPVDRAISNWVYLWADYLNFENALKEESNRITSGYNSFWFYKQLGFYTHQVEAYLQNFSKVKVIFYEDIQKDTQNSLNNSFNFLGVNPEKISTSKRYNVKNLYDSKIFFINKYPKLKKYLFNFSQKSNLESLLFTERTKNIDPILLNKLNFEYRKDLCCLGELLNEDLSHWINKY